MGFNSVFTHALVRMTHCALPMQLNGEGTLCNVTLTAPRRMAAPVFLYYELDNFYQNHRRCHTGSAGVSMTSLMACLRPGLSQNGVLEENLQPATVVLTMLRTQLSRSSCIWLGQVVTSYAVEWL